MEQQNTSELRPNSPVGFLLHLTCNEKSIKILGNEKIEKLVDRAQFSNDEPGED